MPSVPIKDAPNKIYSGKTNNARGIVVHHTASSKKSKDENVIQMCIRGVNKVPGPLYNFLISGDGTIWALTAENIKANHAGRGNKSVLNDVMNGVPAKGKATTPGTISANSRFFGVSIINDGLGQEIPSAQYDACVAVCAYLCDKYGINPLSGVIGHSEWTSRKGDPTFDMGQFRQAVVSRTSEVPEVARLVIAEKPDEEPALVAALTAEKPPETNMRFPGTMRRGSRSQSVKLVQRRVGAKADGIYGRGTAWKVKQWQRNYNRQRAVTTNPLSVDGVVGPMTWRAMNLFPKDVEETTAGFF